MLDELRRLYPQHRVLVLDDASEDGTPELVAERSLSDGMVSMLARDPADRGLSASIFDGIRRCGTERFVVMDCDFQHPPEKAGELLAALDSNDLAIGVRTDRAALTPFRSFSSQVAHLIAHSYLWINGQPTSSDIMTGFFGGRTETVRRIVEENEDRMERRGFKALFDLLKFCPPGMAIAEVEFEFQPRRGGVSKISPLVIVSIFRQCGRGGRAAARLLERAFGL